MIVETSLNRILKKIWKELKSWIGIFCVFVLVNFFLFQPFKIPSGSMIPTLLVGDFLVVNKFCYGYSNASFRMGSFTFPLPTFKERLFSDNLPKRGDVVVFRNEKDRDLNYIKRVIGLPGDTIELKKGIVYINDNPCEVREDGEYSIMDENEYLTFQKYQEKLPNGVEHVIIKRVGFGDARLDNVGPFVVPEGYYFMMGDNRDMSSDSRVMESVGFIPLKNIMGRAEAIFFSSSCKIYEFFKWPFSIRFNRMLTPIK